MPGWYIWQKCCAYTQTAVKGQGQSSSNACWLYVVIGTSLCALGTCSLDILSLLPMASAICNRLSERESMAVKQSRAWIRKEHKTQQSVQTHWPDANGFMICSRRQEFPYNTAYESDPFKSVLHRFILVLNCKVTRKAPFIQGSLVESAQGLQRYPSSTGLRIRLQ